MVAAGTALDAITAEHVSAAFSHPIDVRFDDGRWRARGRHAASAPALYFTPSHFLPLSFLAVAKWQRAGDWALFRPHTGTDHTQSSRTLMRLRS